MKQLARKASLVIVPLFLVWVGTAPALEEHTGSPVTIEAYMTMMDRHSQTMYMLGLIEGYMEAAMLAEIRIAKEQGRPDKEVYAELSGCRWDSYASIKAYVEAALHRVPREQWGSKRVAP